MPNRGVCIAPAAKGDDDVEDITVLGDVGAEPPLVIWNGKHYTFILPNQSGQ